MRQLFKNQKNILLIFNKSQKQMSETVKIHQREKLRKSVTKTTLNNAPQRIGSGKFA